MAFTEAERVQIRRYMGASAPYQQYVPALESAITSVQSEADGGAMPDSSTEDYIRDTVLDKLADIETQLEALWVRAGAMEADKVKSDAERGRVGLYREGRRFVGYLANALGRAVPYADVFSPGPPRGEGLRWYR